MKAKPPCEYLDYGVLEPSIDRIVFGEEDVQGTSQFVAWRVLAAQCGAYVPQAP